MRRTIANSGAAILGIFSAIGAFGNFVQGAGTLRDIMNLVAIKDVSISWPGLYLLGVVASIVVLIAINWEILYALYARIQDRKKKQKRSWN